MDEVRWKKDKTPYIVFECAKCKQYLYAKTTQKGKKCLRCGCHHRISSIIDSGEIVYGMTVAVEKVKEKQNMYAERKLGHKPEFRAFNDYKVAGFASQNVEMKRIGDLNLSIKFQEMLIDISKTYKIFPSYMFEVKAEEYGIELSELKILVHTYQKEGILIRLSDNVYSVNL
ncbi:MAG: hypothetical protein ACFFCI_22995 [Promethearchaeota archaeon]